MGFSKNFKSLLLKEAREAVVEMATDEALDDWRLASVRGASSTAEQEQTRVSKW